MQPPERVYTIYAAMLICRFMYDHKSVDPSIYRKQKFPIFSASHLYFSGKNEHSHFISQIFGVEELSYDRIWES